MARLFCLFGEFGECVLIKLGLRYLVNMLCSDNMVVLHSSD
jgi:hypothetical protein